MTDEMEDSANDWSSASDMGYSSGEEESEAYEDVIMEICEEAPIPKCVGIGREHWIDRAVVAKNEDGQNIADAIIVNCNPNDCIDENGRLGDEELGLLITKFHSTVGDIRMLFKVVRWSIHLVFYDGVNMFNIGRQFDFEKEEEIRLCGTRGGRRRYDSRIRNRRKTSFRKKDITISNYAVSQVSTNDCCEESCVQHFPRHLIKKLRFEVHWAKSKEKATKCLDVHKQIHLCPIKKKKVTMLEGREVCPCAWMLIHDISKRTFERYLAQSKENKRPQVHGNYEKCKPRAATRQALATLKVLLEGAADMMPHRPKTLPTGERIGRKVLPSGTRWNHYLQKVNLVNAQNNLKPISASTLSRIRKTHFTEYSIKKRGDAFARCGTCDKLKKLRDVQTPGTQEYLKVQTRFERHLWAQEAARNAYYGSRALSWYMREKVLCIMHDKMDHSKTASPCIARKNKDTEGLMKLPIFVTGMLTHGHGDYKYAHFALDRHKADSNATIGSIAKLLRDVEKQPVHSSRKMFVGSGTSELYKAILKGKSDCYSSLQATPEVLQESKPLPPILHVQLDNCWKDNKSRYVKCFWSMLVAKSIVREVIVSFMLVGHTHDDIDALFGRWSMKLHEDDYLTIPALMKSYMDLDKVPVIPHMIEEVPDFKKFIAPYIREGEERLVGHSRGRQFRFYMGGNGSPLMQYKMSCASLEWIPLDGIKLWKEDENGRPLLPIGEPKVVKPNKMKNQTEVVKGINGFIKYWNRLVQSDSTGMVKRKLEKVINYWHGVKIAVEKCRDEREDPPSKLKDGFWPKTRQTTIIDCRFMYNGDMREEFGEDEHYIGEAQFQPNPSFRVAIDTRKGFFVFLRAADEGELTKPIWLGLALTDPEFDPTSEHYHKILVRWYTPIGRGSDELTKYQDWNRNPSLQWRPHPMYTTPAWCDTDCICSSWKSQGKNLQKVRPPQKQIKFAEDNLRRCIAAELLMQE